MGGYLGTKAVLLSTTAANVTGNADITGNLTVQGAFTSQGIDDNANATAITIDSSENVSIGHASPTAILDVRRGDASGKIAEFHTNTGFGIELGSSQSEAYVQAGSSQALLFNTNVSNERMRITSAGRVGVGTNSPDAPLHVEGASGTQLVVEASSGNFAQMDFKIGGTQKGAIWTYEADDLMGFFAPSGWGQNFYTNGTETMRLTSAGDLGLGTTSPRSDANITTLEVSGSTFARQILQATNTGGREYGLVTGTSGSFLIHDYTAPATRLTLTSAGNLGIGITSPTQALVVSESSTPTIQIKDGLGSGTRVSGRLHIGESDTLGVSIENSTTSYNDNCTMVFKTSPAAGTITERMRLTSAGEMLIGKTAAVAAGAGLWLYKSGTSFGRINYGTSITGTSFPAVFYNNSGSEAGSISYSTTATSYNTSSDYRLKTDAQPMTGASARVQALNPVNFEWIAYGTRVDGFLAHEAATVVPEAVTGEKDAMRDEEYEVTPAVEATFDEEGNVLTEAVEAVMGTRSVPDYQGIDQSKIVPLLTAALQEALTKIDSLETRLTALEGA